MQRKIWLAGLAVLGVVVVGLNWPTSPRPSDLPELVSIPAGTFAYRPGGEFRRGPTVLTPPLQTIAGNALTIMRHPVTEAAYAVCVADHACAPVQTSGAADLPQTFVSFDDATAFAAWQSTRTGQVWRLPTDAEWVQAAGERWADDGLPDTENTNDPAQRWIAAYRANADLRGAVDAVLHPVTAQGDNALGVGGIGGNLWEWTTTCFQRVRVDDAGVATTMQGDYCGVRAAQGKHRAFIIEFVRDARVGGCAVGLPPDYLGFRLVKE